MWQDFSMGINRFDLVTFTSQFDRLTENINLGYIFEWWVLRQNFPVGTNRFDLVILTLAFDPNIENFNFGYNFFNTCRMY
jgi:hypothetical protein